MDHTSGTIASMKHAGSGAPMLLAPQAFADRLADSSAIVINVHVSADPAIARTDTTIPHDREAGGYSDVSHLDGGLAAWRRAGLSAEPR